MLPRVFDRPCKLPCSSCYRAGGQAIKGLASEFQVPAVHRRVLEDEGKEPSWLLFNGAFALFLAFGVCV